MAKKPSALSIADLDAPVILSFLESLEQQRHNQAQSRNVRLTAIRSFFRLVALRDPTSVGVATRVLAIPLKRIDQHLVGYLQLRAGWRGCPDTDLDRCIWIDQMFLHSDGKHIAME
jgi:site-specific recombinase XerD